MEGRAMEDFIRYAKEQFGCNIYLRECGMPDSFETIFGADFSGRDGGCPMEKIAEFEGDLLYENISAEVCWEMEGDLGFPCMDSIGLAA